MDISATQRSLAPLVRRLASIFDLSDAEKEAALALPADVRTIKSGQDIVREGDRPSRSCLILDGLVCPVRSPAKAGGRFLPSISRATVRSCRACISAMDYSVCALEPSTVAFITHEDLRRLIKQHPRIGDAFWRDTLIDAAVFREWVVGIRRRSAHCRIAHLFASCSSAS
jgi:CRP-like cAMP-binding protein